MDIKDGFATSSKKHLWSLIRVHELDEITSNGGKDRSATKEHPRGLKRKRLKDRLGDQRGGSEWDLIKIHLEGD
jgi:hypothetical protein